MKNIIIAIDTWNLVNGITTIYRNLFNLFKIHKAYNFIIVYPRNEFRVTYIDSNIIECGLALSIKYQLPFYPEIIQGLPKFNWYSFLKNNFGDISLIHITTQGIVGAYFSIIAKKYKIKSTGFYHTFMPLFIKHYIPRYIGILEPIIRIFFKQVDKFIYNNCYQIFYHTNESKIYLSNLLSDKKFTPVTGFLLDNEVINKNIHNKYFDNKSKIKLGYIGRLSKEKNIKCIIKLEPYFKKHNIQLIIIGDGPLKNYIRKNSNYEITGYLFGQDLISMIQKIDFNLIPNSTDTLNLTLFESASQKIPTIAFENSIPSKIIKEYDSGLVYRDFNDHNWIVKLRTELSHERYIQMQKNCSKLAKDNHINNSSKIIIESWTK